MIAKPLLDEQDEPQDDPSLPKKPTSQIKPSSSANVNQIASGATTQPATPSTPNVGPAAAAPPMTPPAMTAPSVPSTPDMSGTALPPVTNGVAAPQTPQAAPAIAPLAPADPDDGYDPLYLESIRPKMPTFTGAPPTFRAGAGYANGELPPDSAGSDPVAYQKMLQDMGPANETQEQFNVRRGLAINPRTGAWEKPDVIKAEADRAGRSFAAVLADGSLSGYNADGTSQGLPGTGEIPENYTFPTPPVAEAPASTPVASGPREAGTYLIDGVLQDEKGTPIQQPTSTPTVGPAVSTPNTPPSAAAPSVGGAAAPSVGPASTPQGVGLATVNPDADLRSQSVLPTNQVNRFDLVKDRFNDYLANALPQYKAKYRGATQNAAALGRLGSGMFRTDLGNLDLAEQRAANSTFANLLSDATEGTIGDARSDRNEYRTERDYQTGQEEQAYRRGIEGLTLEDALTNSAFGRALQQQLAGQANNPAQTQLLLSSIFGNQASAAGQALARMIQGNASKGAVAGNAAIAPGDVTGGDLSDLPEWLRNILGGGSSSSGDTYPSDEDYGVAP